MTANSHFVCPPIIPPTDNMKNMEAALRDALAFVNTALVDDINPTMSKRALVQRIEMALSTLHPLAATPAVGGGAIEIGARAIARSQGHDPDELAPRTAMCTADNQQVAWWHVFEEQAEACLLAAQPASPLRGDIRAALFSPETAHARHNLEGALYDIERFRDQGKPTDEVCIRTIKRVIEQLAKTERALSASPPEQPQRNLGVASDSDRTTTVPDRTTDATPRNDPQEPTSRDSRERPAPPEHPAAALVTPCSHPKAKVWFYRDDDTYMRCEDCGRRWCESPAATPFQPHENCNCLMCLAEKSR